MSIVGRRMFLLSFTAVVQSVSGNLPDLLLNFVDGFTFGGSIL